MHELEAMRDVLTPSELRAGPGLEVECLFGAAADGVAGAFYLVTLAAHRPQQELFGERRLTEALRELAGSAPGAVVRRLESDVLAHAGNSLGDDLCIVAARVNAT